MFSRLKLYRTQVSEIPLLLLQRLSGSNGIFINKPFSIIRPYYRLASKRVTTLKKTASLFVTGLTFVGIKKSSSLTDMEESLAEILKEADNLFERDKFEESLTLLSAYKDQPKADVKWRQGRALYKMCETNIECKRKLIEEGFELVNESLTLNYNDAGAHIWMAAILDAKSELDGICTRLSKIPEVRKYLLNAVKINPNDAMAWYCLGCFSYGIANATWHERQVLRCVGITETYEHALEYFLRAEQENPNFSSLTILNIGKCYHAIGDCEKAEYYLTVASNVVVLNKDDQKCKEAATAMLTDYFGRK